MDFVLMPNPPQDVYEAVDRMHTQIMDEQQATDDLEKLENVLRILENAMNELLDIEGVRGI